MAHNLFSSIVKTVANSTYLLLFCGVVFLCLLFELGTLFQDEAHGAEGTNRLSLTNPVVIRSLLLKVCLLGGFTSGIVSWLQQNSRICQLEREVGDLRAAQIYLPLDAISNWHKAQVASNNQKAPTTSEATMNEQSASHLATLCRVLDSIANRLETPTTGGATTSPETRPPLSNDQHVHRKSEVVDWESTTDDLIEEYPTLQVQTTIQSLKGLTN